MVGLQRDTTARVSRSHATGHARCDEMAGRIATSATTIERGHRIASTLRWVPWLSSRLERNLEAGTESHRKLVAQHRGLLKRVANLEGILDQLRSGTIAAYANPVPDEMALLSWLEQVRGIRERGPTQPLAVAISECLEAIKHWNSWQGAILTAAAGDSEPYRPETPSPAVVDTRDGRREPARERHEALPPQRIWLTVPRSAEKDMLRLGAHLDTGAQAEATTYERQKTLSRVFILPKQSPGFESALPLLERSVKPKIRFGQLQKGARGQNLHEVFDEQTWNAVRFRTYAETGGRCKICGTMSSKSWRAMNKCPSDDRRGGSMQFIDAHEVWDFDVADEDNRTGIQKLDRVVGLCRDCHMLFHTDAEVSAAQKRGGLDNRQAADMAEDLLTRQAEVNGISVQEMEQWNDIDRRAAAQRDSAVDLWVLDLSKLADSSILAGKALPTLLPGNPAGITAEMVAGLSFQDADRTVFPARTVEELVSERAAMRADFRGPARHA